MYDFANLLFAGPCNRACPFCVGRQLPARANPPNLDVFPPRGLDAFVEAVNHHRIADVVFTGTTSDPQLYAFEAELLAELRARLHPGARFSLHTNGVRVLARLSIFNRYDRACISLPTFSPATYEKMMGRGPVPDLAAILELATIPLKVSAVVSEDNSAEIDDFVRRCSELGVQRLVIRKLLGETRRWPILRGLTPVREHRGNPVYDYRGMEVTYWDFAEASSKSINLYADGTLGTEYLLTRQFAPQSATSF